MASRAKHDLTAGKIGPTLLKFAVPTLISSVLQSLQGSINTVWVGRFIGEGAVAATANANMILFLTMSFVFGFGMAATILVGQAFGARDIDRVRRVIGSVIGGFIAFSIPLSALGWYFAPDLLQVMGVPPAAMPAALAYLRVIFLAMPTGMVMTVLMMTLRGAGDALTPLWFMGLALVIDCGLNPLLINGIGPIPAMGIAGSATATVIANLVCMVALFVTIYVRDLPIRLRGPELAYLKPSRALGATIMKMGLPLGLQMIAMAVASIAILGLVNREGVDTTAAYGVTLQLWTYVQMPAMSLSAAVSAMAAQNIGAGRWDRIREITNKGIGYNLLITGALVVVLAFADKPALALFIGDNSPALPIAQHIQLLVTWSFMMSGVTFVLIGTVRANGAVIAPLLILVFSMIPVRIGFAMGLHPSLGADGLWISGPIASFSNMVLAWLYYRYSDWRKPRVHMGPPPGADDAIEGAAAMMDPEGRLSPTG